MRHSQGKVAKLLHGVGAELWPARLQVARLAGRGRTRLGWAPFGWGTEYFFEKDAQIAFKQAGVEATRFASEKLYPEHLLAGLIYTETSNVCAVLEALGVDMKDLNSRLNELLVRQAQTL